MLTLIEPTNMGSWGSTDVKISGISNRQDLRIWWGQKTTGAWCLVVWPALHVFKCRYYIYIYINIFYITCTPNIISFPSRSQ